MANDIIVFNIREFFSDKEDKVLGEEALQRILSEFSCDKNPDVEDFLKNKSIEFTRKNQSVTYLVFANDDAALLGYFTITINPISVKADAFSKNMQRKLSRVSELDEESGVLTLPTYLIAQLGKNYANHVDQRITGDELLQAAIHTIQELQYMAGGMVMFLEADEREKLMAFYEEKNGFKRFAVRETSAEKENPHTLVQLLKIIS